MDFREIPVARVVELASDIHIKTKRLFEASLRDLGLTWPQYGILLSLVEGSPRTQKELAGAWDADPNTVMVIVNSLEARGWAKREQNPLDARSRLVSITLAGKGVLLSAEPRIFHLMGPLFSAIDQSEAQSILPVLNKILDAIKATAPSCADNHP
jgi:DNA-binding MarR family transcriptional regulator